MGYREQEHYRKFLEEEARLEQEAQERRMAPIREAEAALQETHKKLRDVYRERLLAKTRDPEPFIDPSVANARMSHADASAFNTRAWREFFTINQHLFSPELDTMLRSYFTVNNLEIITASMFENVVRRIVEAGLLPEPTHIPAEPEPEPVAQPEPEPEIPAGPRETIGRDPYTGRDRSYTAFEIENMSGEFFALCFPVARTFQRFFNEARQQREAR